MQSLLPTQPLGLERARGGAYEGLCQYSPVEKEVVVMKEAPGKSQRVSDFAVKATASKRPEHGHHSGPNAGHGTRGP